MVRTLPFADQQVSVPGYGAMGLSFGLGNKFTFEQAQPVLLKALEQGATFWDTAVVYAAGANERLIGEFLRKHNVRDKIFLASKCGFEVDFDTGANNGVTNKPAHIKEYIEGRSCSLMLLAVLLTMTAGTIERLGGPPDLYYLHRIDPNTPLEESISALDDLRKAGKTKYIGLSECSAKTLRKANSIAKIDAIQAEYSPFETVHEADELIATAKELGVAFVPVGRGFLSGELKSPDDFAVDDIRRTMPKFQGENFHKNLAIVKEFQEVARKKGCTPSQLSLAWVIAQGCIPIPGTSRVERVEENTGARDIDLTDAELAELRKVIDAAKPAGVRYSAQGMSLVGH